MTSTEMEKLLALVEKGSGLDELERIMGAHTSSRDHVTSLPVFKQLSYPDIWESFAHLFCSALFAAPSWEDERLRRVFNELLRVESEAPRLGHPGHLVELFVKLLQSKPSMFTKRAEPMSEDEWHRMFQFFWNEALKHSCITERTFQSRPSSFSRRRDSPWTGACVLAHEITFYYIPSLDAWKDASVRLIYREGFRVQQEGTLYMLKELTDYLSGRHVLSLRSDSQGSGRIFFRSLWTIAVGEWVKWGHAWTNMYHGRLFSIPLTQAWELDKDLKAELQSLRLLMDNTSTYSVPSRVYDEVVDTLKRSEVRRANIPSALSMHIASLILDSYVMDNQGCRLADEDRLIGHISICLVQAYDDASLRPYAARLFDVVAQKLAACYAPKTTQKDALIREKAIQLVSNITTGFGTFMRDEQNVLSTEEWEKGPLKVYELALKALEAGIEREITIAGFLTAPFLSSKGPGRAADYFGRLFLSTYAGSDKVRYTVQELQPALQFFMHPHVNVLDMDKDMIDYMVGVKVGVAHKPKPNKPKPKATKAAKPKAAKKTGSRQMRIREFVESDSDGEPVRVTRYEMGRGVTVDFW